MTFVLVLLVCLAGLSLGLCTTSLLMDPLAHPLDRLALSIIAGTLWTALVLEVTDSYRIFDFGLGLMLSLSPAGMFDITKWWFRSRGRCGHWLSAAAGRRVGLRWLFLIAMAGAAVLAIVSARS